MRQLAKESWQAHAFLDQASGLLDLQLWGMALVHDSTGDFLLFPRDQSYMDMLDLRLDDGFDGLHYGSASDGQHQRLDLAGTTYGSYQPSSGFSTSTSNFYSPPNFVFDEPKESEKVGRYTPSGTPSPSVSQSFDHPPSILSSASGTSSAVGSPYSHATSNIPGQEHWAETQRGLGIDPGIVRTEGFGHDIYPLHPVENDLDFNNDKFPNSFVGESTKVLSSSASASSISSSVSSSSASQNFIPALSALPLVLDTSMVTRNVTIDTILNEVKSKIDTPTHLISPASARGMKISPASPHGGYSLHSPLQMNGSFKSPKTPASAMSPFTPRATPPTGAWQHDFRRHPMTACGDSKTPQSPSPSLDRFHPYGRRTPPSYSQAQFHKLQPQSPFFSQSSGRFIAPLESSCWFSLTVIPFLVNAASRACPCAICKHLF